MMELNIISVLPLATVAVVTIITTIIIEFPSMLGVLAIAGRTPFVSNPILSITATTGATITRGDSSRFRCYSCWSSNKCVSQFDWL